MIFKNYNDDRSCTKKNLSEFFEIIESNINDNNIVLLEKEEKNLIADNDNNDNNKKIIIKSIN